MLVKWRLQHWKNDWRDGWPSYGPCSLIPDSDLDNLAKHAGKIESVDNLIPLVHGVVNGKKSPRLSLLPSNQSSYRFMARSPFHRLCHRRPNFSHPPDIWDLILEDWRSKKRRKTQAAAWHPEKLS
jgi:hypothetical protein